MNRGADAVNHPRGAGNRRPDVRPARRPRGDQLTLVVTVAVGGVVGALARDAVSLAWPAPDGTVPWATVVINLSGSLVLGALLVLLAEQFPRNRFARPLLGTGVIGAYTTFSTFTVQAAELVRDGHDVAAVVYLAVSLVGGVAAAAGGVAAARLAVRARVWARSGR